jgi:hypothetical protein
MTLLTLGGANKQRSKESEALRLNATELERKSFSY